MRKPVIFFLTFLFVLISLADIITAKFILKGEANPIFVLLGNYWILFAVKMAFLSLVIMIYVKWYDTSDMFQFAYILCLVLGIMVTSIAVYSNITGIINKEVVTQAEKIPASVKIKEYFRFASFFYFLPLIFSLISFKLYEVNKWN